MKYEFHVGDYVENNYGKVGYITSVKYTKSNKDVFYDIEIGYYNADIVGVFRGDQSLIQDHFNRIGQQDFTKPEVKKIDHFEYTYPYSEISLTAKINELVDAVNELRETVMR